MHPILIYLIGTLPVVAIVILVTYLRFKWGIATRLFVVAAMLVLINTICGIILGLDFSITRLGIAILLLAPLDVGLAFLLFRLVVTDLEKRMSQLVASTNQISATASQAAATATEQAAVVAQVKATIAELTQTSEAAASAASKVVAVSGQAVDQSQAGLNAISEAERIMSLIGDVAEIVENVSELAEQSNLLAVNASIEAAKAGDQGLGFSVVAGEVRNLSAQSKASAQQIRAAIQRVREGQSAIGVTRTVIDKLASDTEGTADAARLISASAAQQAAGIQQINQAMENVAQGGSDTEKGARELQQATDHLREIAGALHRLITGSEDREVKPGLGF